MSNRRSSDNSIQSFQSADSASSSSGDIGSSSGLHSLAIPVPIPTPNSKRRVPVPSPLAPNRPASPIRIVLRPVPTPPGSNGLDSIDGERRKNGHGLGTGSANFDIDLMEESQWPVSPERNLKSNGMGRRINSTGSFESNSGLGLGYGGAERIPLPNSPTSL